MGIKTSTKNSLRGLWPLPPAESPGGLTHLRCPPAGGVLGETRPLAPGPLDELCAPPSPRSGSCRSHCAQAKPPTRMEVKRRQGWASWESCARSPDVGNAAQLHLCSCSPAKCHPFSWSKKRAFGTAIWNMRYWPHIGNGNWWGSKIISCGGISSLGNLVIGSWCPISCFRITTLPRKYVSGYIIKNNCCCTCSSSRLAISHFVWH